jgi:N-acetylmuramoyl-L-alanine amidase
LTPQHVPSPNRGPRRGGARPDLVVIHYTAMQTAEAALERLCDPAAQVSAHYLIAKTGAVTQMVDEAERAWHAGAGAWGRTADINSRSIGIELDNTGREPFSEPLMAALEQVLAGILSRWAIPPERVIGHSDMAPHRKADPGPRFDWRRLALQGLSVWPEAATPGNFGADAAQVGWRAHAGAEDPEALVLEALRLRFRPWAAGPLDRTDRAIAADLARRFPVDRRRGEA